MTTSPHPWIQEYYWSGPWPAQQIYEMWPKPFSASGGGYWVTELGREPNGFGVVATGANTPASFDSRQAWPGAAQRIFNQRSCGSCWAFGGVETLSDRWFVSGLSASPPELSPQSLVSCDTDNDGCNGGWIAHSWNYMVEQGVTTCTDLCTAGCDPYVSGNCSEGTDKEHDGCHACHYGTCAAGSPWTDTYRASGYRSVLAGEALIRKEIATNGPTEVCFTIYHNFYSFFRNHPTGIYDTTNSTSVVGGHCVKIIGWGEEDGKPFWLIANSWGTGFGDQGFFRFLRGSNLCDMEGGVVSGYTSTQTGVSLSRGSWQVRKSTDPHSPDPVAPLTGPLPNPGIEKLPMLHGGFPVERNLKDADVIAMLQFATEQQITARLGLGSHALAVEGEALGLVVHSQVVAGIKYSLTYQNSTVHIVCDFSGDMACRV